MKFSEIKQCLLITMRKSHVYRCEIWYKLEEKSVWGDSEIANHN